MLLSQSLSFFLSISRFIQKHLVSGVEWQRKWHKHKNRYRFNRIFLVFLFCFVSIVLMYEWLNMKIKRNIDRFLGFRRWTVENFFLRIYRETLGFYKKNYALLNYYFDNFWHDFMLNQVQFTYKRFTELLASTSINQYGKFKILHEITLALERYGVLQDFVATCLGHFLNFDEKTLFSSRLVHSLLAREIVVDGVGDSKLYFEVEIGRASCRERV